MAGLLKGEKCIGSVDFKLSMSDEDTVRVQALGEALSRHIIE